MLKIETRIDNYDRERAALLANDLCNHVRQVLENEADLDSNDPGNIACRVAKLFERELLKRREYDVAPHGYF